MTSPPTVDPRHEDADPLHRRWLEASEFRPPCALDTMRELLALGVNIDHADPNGNTALHKACLRDTPGNTMENLSFLLSHGANPNLPNSADNTSFEIVSFNGDIHQMYLLLEHGAAINACDRNGWTALHMAISRTQEEVVRFLLDKGARHDLFDGYGRSALHLAAAPNRADDLSVCIVSLLLEHGADPVAPNHVGHTALATARMEGSVQIVALMEAHMMKKSVQLQPPRHHPIRL